MDEELAALGAHRPPASSGRLAAAAGLFERHALAEDLTDFFFTLDAYARHLVGR
jgi:hypothetical protein